MPLQRGVNERLKNTVDFKSARIFNELFETQKSGKSEEKFAKTRQRNACARHIYRTSINHDGALHEIGFRPQPLQSCAGRCATRQCPLHFAIEWRLTGRRFMLLSVIEVNAKRTLEQHSINALCACTSAGGVGGVDAC